VADEANAQYGDFCRVKEDDLVPPTNPWKRPVNDHPLRLTEGTWRGPSSDDLVQEALANGGALVEGPPGTGKSEFIKSFVAACPGTVCVTAHQISAARPNETLYTVLRRGKRYATTG
jgi:MoxR-like ATPase